MSDKHIWDMLCGGWFIPLDVREYYSPIKKKQCHCSGMDGPRDYHTQSARQREIYHSYVDSGLPRRP